MKIKYATVRKIHLYACLSTCALLLMFIITSFIMVHHDSFDHSSKTEVRTINYGKTVDKIDETENWLKQQGVYGRLAKKYINQGGNHVLEYNHAGGSHKVTFISDKHLVEIIETSKSDADAIVGIHRQRGYGGRWKYTIHAFFLDIMAISLLLFTITGLYMWLRWYKKDRWVWVVFFSGLIYFGTFVCYFTFA